MKIKHKLILLSIFLLLGCENAGQQAARIIANDVIPQITLESEEWRKIAEETSNKLPSQFREEFNLVFNRALQISMTSYQCGVDFARTRLRQDLMALEAKWSGQISENILEPIVCGIFPAEKIELNDKNRPKVKDVFSFQGYDFLDYDRKPLVKVIVEYANNKKEDRTKLLLDNPTHYILTVNFDNFSFEQKVRRIILTDNNNKELYTVPVDYAEQVAAPVLLKKASVMFITTDDNKDYNTKVHVNLICNGSTVASILGGDWGEFKDNKASDWKNLQILDNSLPKTTILTPRKCIFNLIEQPQGDDEWHFIWKLKLEFTEGIPKEYQGTGNVDSDRNTLNQFLVP